MILGLAPGSSPEHLGMVAICSYRRWRCRVCGGRDCLGALDHVFALCNSQRPEVARAPSLEALDDAPELPDPRQLFLFPPPARAFPP